MPEERSASSIRDPLDRDARFAARTFRWAAIYGIIVLLPVYFIPSPHPYRLSQIGFVGTALVFQLVFLVIARDPRRYRDLMPVAILEKLAFGMPALVFYVQGNADRTAAIFGTLDLLLGALFLYSWQRVSRST